MRASTCVRFDQARPNPYSFKDPDGRCPICIPIGVGIGICLTSGPANAPAPGEPTVNVPVGEQIASAIPNGGRATSMFKMTARRAHKLAQRAATREAKREAGILTSQQAQSQTNGSVGSSLWVGNKHTRLRRKAVDAANVGSSLSGHARRACWYASS